MKAPVLPLYNYKDDKGVYHIVFGEPVSLQEGESREQTLQIMTQKYDTVLEEIIREYPEQWMWVHRRWKEYRE